MPRFFIDEKLAIVSKNWELNSSEKNYLDSINIINEKCILMEQDTIQLTEKKEWLFCNKGKIETCRAHRILIRQRNIPGCNIPGILAECSLSVAMFRASREYIENISKENIF